ncbi:YDG domain-containing protein [Dyella terrae]|uniref:YDG domain-containing protein n=1 Tax=Dyella terrae TaxID=522259 RepID=UPI001EFE0EBF|nr:YDG domain-containing protein [Dyella terrae]ULU23727.1 hemagglutination activity domain containing protein [Dyella terrae]
MNHIYRLCWNRALRAWVPASELAKGKAVGVTRRGAAARTPLMLSLLSVSLGMTGLAWAGVAPTGGQVVAGSGQIQQSGNVTTIQQNSQTLSLNWQSFDVGAGQTVNFQQPGTSSIAVNRILGNTASDIEGHLNANGQVWLINPNGVLFGKGAQVNVGGIVASTLDLDDSTLGTDNVRFAGNGRGKVVNQGSISAAPGGYVALLGNQVSNQGVIRAQLGTVALGGGTAMTLTFKDNHLMHLVVNENTVRSLVENRQLIVADGGSVLMTAGARASLIDSVVNNTGTVQAHSVAEHDGTITLLGGMEAGTVQVGGTLDASAPQGGNGGTIETSAAHFVLAGDAHITAASAYGKGGTWLVDPVDLTIDGAAATTISNTLNGGTSVTEQTTSTGSSGLGNAVAGSGDINVNAAINWNSAATLTLDAYRNINVNAAITGSNGGVALNTGYGNGGNTGKLTIAGTGSVSAGSGATINTGAFVNNGSSSALGAKWMLYTVNPAANTLGGITPNYIQYNATQGSTLAASGNGLLYSVAPTLTIGGLTGTVSKVYDNTAAASFAGANFNATGLLGGDAISSATGGSYASVNVGNGITVTSPGAIGSFVITNGGIPVYGYALGGSPISAAVGAITPAQLTAKIIDTPTKIYDGTTTATLGSSNYEIDGFVSGQGAAVSQPSSVAYAGSSAGSQQVNATFSVTNFNANNGTSLSNYILPTAATGLGYINQAPLLISGLLASNKVYSGTADASLVTSGASLYGIIQPDVGQVSLNYGLLTGAFAQSNVGNGIAVSVGTGAAQLTGNKAGNYYLVAPSGLTANITPKALTISQVTASNKTYDGTTTATLNTGSGSLFGVVGTDNVTLSSAGATGNFSQSDVGNNLAVSTSGFGLGGTAAANYTLIQPTLYANITPALLTISMTGTPEKTYDGTQAVTLGQGNFNITGFVGSQHATVFQSSASYATPNAGSNIDVTATLQPSDFTPASGTSMSNYTFASTVVGSGLGKIDPLQLIGQIVGNPTKTYDGNTNASLSASNLLLQGLLPGQSITASFSGTESGTYANANAGAWKVTAGNLPAGDFTAGNGTLLSNYILPVAWTGSGTIVPAPLSGQVITAGITGASKVYDGTVYITLGAANFLLSGFVGGDNATVNSGASIQGTFGQSDVGTNIPLSATLHMSDLSGQGSTNLNNYTLAAPSLGVGNITPAPLIVSIIGNPTKVYNGSIDAALTSSNFSVTGWATATGEGGSINPTATAQYDSINAGARTVTAVLAPGNYVTNANTKLSNYTLVYSASGAGTITQAPLYITGVYATGKIYDTTTKDTLNTAAAGLAGLVSADVGNVSLDVSGASANFAQKNVGTSLAVTASGFALTGGQASNYLLQPLTGLFADINKATLTLSGVTANNKTYNGNNAATLTVSGSAALNGVLGSDTVGFDTSGQGATFVTANAGTNLAVTTSGFTLTGTDAGNYQLNQPAGLTATINPAPLTAIITGSPTKVYDGTNSATLTAGDYQLQGFVGTDGASVPQSATASYVTKNAGTGLGVESTLVTSDFVANGGTNLANYILPTTGFGTNGVITPLVLNLTATRIYDGTSNANASLFGPLQGVNGETLGLNGSGTLSSKNVGSKWSFNSLGSLQLADGSNGGLASNYTLVGGTDWVTITPRPLTATFDASNKVYDGNTTDTLSNAALVADNGSTSSGLVAGDSVNLTNPTAGNFNNKNAGNGKTVTGAMGITGTDAGNYIFTNGTATANITPLAITVSATGKNKVYDGNTNDPGLTLAGAGVLTGDTINFASNSVAFSDANVANGKTITVNNITAGGADANNYTFNTSATTTANITPYLINLTGSRLYDGTVGAGYALFSSNGVLSTGVNGETLTLSGIGSAADKNVGNGKGVAFGTLALSNGSSGDLASNYQLNSAKLTITPRPLTATFDASNKVYDGNTGDSLSNAALVDANGSLTSGLVAGDDVSLTNPAAGNFADKNVGTGKTVTGAMGVSGADAGNYVFTNGTSTADITKRDLTVGAVGSNKVYDGNTSASVTLGSDGVAGDNLTYADTSASYGGKDVGSYTINVQGISVGGTDAGNYNLINTTATAGGNITPVVLNLSGSRVYDTTNQAGVGTFNGGGTLAGVNGETVTLNGPYTLASSNAGTYNHAWQAGDGLGLGNGGNGGIASNYVIGNVSYTVTPYVLDLNSTRVYDGTVNADASLFGTGGVLTGLNGQTVSLGGTGHVGDKNVGNNKAFADLGSLALSDGSNGGLGSNYTLIGGTDTLTITPKTISVTATANNKVYDTTDAAAVASLTGNGTIAGDTLTYGSGAATFADANAANGKTVTVNGLTLGGADAGNYQLSGTTATTTANITPYVLNLNGTRVYDGTVNADASLFGANGVLAGLNGQTVNLGGAGHVGDKNVGNNKAFADLGSLTLSDGSNGGLGSNYTLVGGTDTLTITPKTINVTATANNKVYDTSDAATIDTLTGNGIIAGDALSYGSGAATFADANAANGKTVTVNGLTLGGTDAGNYTLANTTTTTTANITPYVLNLNGTRVYDGTVNADASLFGTAGVLAGLNGQTVSLGGTGHVGDKNVGNNKAFADLGSLALSNGSNGGLGSNYTLVGGTDTLTITPKIISVTATANNKVYDTTDAATVASLTGNGTIAGDTLTYGSGAATFADANAANGKTVTVNGLTLGGADAGNYQLSGTTATTTANITPYVLNLNGTRVYDGTVNADASLFGANGVLAGLNGQTVNLGGAGHVGDKNVGSNKAFANLGSLALSNGSNGGLGSNYTLVGGTDTLTITPKALGATATANDRVYDGTVIAGLTGASLVGLVGGDQVALNNASQGTFADKNVGNSKAVTTNMTIGGADAGNYDFTTATGITANVTPKLIDVTATAANKVYDTTAGATVTTLSGNGLIAGDAVSFGFGSANFSDANAANGKTVTVGGLTKAGADAGNYTLANTTTTTTADITPYVLSLNGTRVYDGSVNAGADLFGANGVLTGLNGQTVNLGGTGHVGDRSVGNNKAFADLGSLALSNGSNGGLGSNYTLVGGTDTLTITPKTVVVNATGTDKMFDGNTYDTVTLGSQDILTGDLVQIGKLAANFFDPSVANGKTVSVTGLQLSGADAGNYVLSSTATTTRASITGARPSAFGIDDGLLAQLSSAVGPAELPTPYGLAAQDTVGPYTGNKKKLHHPVERNVSRDDFTSGLSLRVIDGGLRVPVQALP